MLSSVISGSVPLKLRYLTSFSALRTLALKTLVEHLSVSSLGSWPSTDQMDLPMIAPALFGILPSSLRVTLISHVVLNSPSTIVNEDDSSCISVGLMLRFLSAAALPAPSTSSIAAASAASVSFVGLLMTVVPFDRGAVLRTLRGSPFPRWDAHRTRAGRLAPRGAWRPLKCARCRDPRDALREPATIHATHVNPTCQGGTIDHPRNRCRLRTARSAPAPARRAPGTPGRRSARR
jgi:hypothetical protein